jgi:hypothetical protein
VHQHQHLRVIETAQRDAEKIETRTLTAICMPWTARRSTTRSR